MVWCNMAWDMIYNLCYRFGSGILHQIPVNALRLLRAQGLASPALHKVTMATTMTRMLYDAPAWWCLTSAYDKSRFERFKDKVTRMGYLQASDTSVPDSVAAAEQSLLRSIERNPTFS